MKLRQLSENTYLLRGGTNSGIYKLPSGNIVVIDPGLSAGRGKKIVNYAQENNIKISHVIATHEHADHINALEPIIDEFPDVEIYIDPHGHYLIENPDSMLAYINCGLPSQKIINLARPMQTIKNLKALPNGEFQIEGVNFEWIYYGGHSAASGGLITDNKVLFIGDTLVAPTIYDKYPFPVVYDVQKQYHAIEHLRNLHFETCIIGHAKKAFTKDECLEIIDLTYKYINDSVEIVLEATKTPISRHDILAYTLNKLKVEYKYYEYLIAMTSLGSILTYLSDRDLVQDEIINNQHLYKMTT